MTQVRERFERICRNQSGFDGEITDDTHLYDHLNLDSLDRIDLMVRVENEFNVDIADAEIDPPETGTFGGMLALIESKLACA